MLLCHWYMVLLVLYTYNCVTGDVSQVTTLTSHLPACVLQGTRQRLARKVVLGVE
jgi:hypothetical protein